eukprot:2076903-Prymnesium_polylepis.1
MPAARCCVNHTSMACGASTKAPPPARRTLSCFPRSTRKSFRLRIRRRAWPTRTPSRVRNATSDGTRCCDGSKVSPRPESSANSQPRSSPCNPVESAARHANDESDPSPNTTSIPRCKSSGVQPSRSRGGG